MNKVGVGAAAVQIASTRTLETLEGHTMGKEMDAKDASGRFHGLISITLLCIARLYGLCLCRPLVPPQSSDSPPELP